MNRSLKWKPVEVVKDVISTTSGSEQAGSRVPDVLKFIEHFVR